MLEHWTKLTDKTMDWFEWWIEVDQYLYIGARWPVSTRPLCPCSSLSRGIPSHHLSHHVHHHCIQPYCHLATCLSLSSLNFVLLSHDQALGFVHWEHPRPFWAEAHWARREALKIKSIFVRLVVTWSRGHFQASTGKTKECYFPLKNVLFRLFVRACSRRLGNPFTINRFIDK